MNQAEVRLVFNGFRSSGQEEFHDRSLESTNVGLMGRPARVVYRANIDQGVRVGYWPSWPSGYEVCDVYFDTNGIIAGYECYHFR